MSICGARLTAASGVRTVYAPSTHSVPEIECVGERGEGGDARGGARETGYDAEVVIREQDSGIRGAGRICPGFGGIWAPPAGGGSSIPGSSFHPVKPSPPWFYMLSG